MTDPRINLKNPILAGVLALLLPGAGHLYQGRLFKAGVYFTCILGLFFSGMAVADWRAVQPPPKPVGSRITVLKYTAQLAVGLPSMYGLLQRERYYSDSNRQGAADLRKFSAPFRGELEVGPESDFYEDVQGTVHLEPVVDSFGEVMLTGKLDVVIDGQPQTFQLGQHVRLGKPIQANPERALRASLVRDAESPFEIIGNISGFIPRPFRNWFQVPMEEEEVQDLHAKLGKYHELAMVLTWIAGLLNVLAIWDAVEGPAYGFGDEEEPAADPTADETAPPKTGSNA